MELSGLLCGGQPNSILLPEKSEGNTHNILIDICTWKKKSKLVFVVLITGWHESHVTLQMTC